MATGNWLVRGNAPLSITRHAASYANRTAGACRPFHAVGDRRTSSPFPHIFLAQNHHRPVSTCQYIFENPAHFRKSYASVSVGKKFVWRTKWPAGPLNCVRETATNLPLTKRHPMAGGAAVSC